MAGPRRFALACVLLWMGIALSGCGGAATVSSVPAAPVRNGPVGAAANARIVIVVPSASKASARKPAYVSPSTQSMTVQVDGGTPAATNLTPSSPNCSVPGPLSPLTCVVNIPASAGSHTFTFATYDQTNAAGNRLSVNSLTQTLLLNQLNNVNLTLAGIPKALQVLPAAGASGISGDQGSGLQFLFGAAHSIVVTAVDADGNYIVGPGSPALAVSATAVSAGSGITVAAAAAGGNEFTVQSTGFGTATLAITATPASALAGSPLSINVPLSATTMTTTLAGDSRSTGYGFTNGTGINASFAAPSGITYDSANGNLYVTDTNNCAIRQVTLAGVVTTIAGSPACGFADGTGSAAKFNYPSFIVYDPNNGNLYVTDTYNCSIRQVTAAGVVTTLAGSSSCGFVDGTGSAAKFADPSGIAFDSNDGNLYVTDADYDEIRRVSTSGVVTTVAGASTQGSPGSSIRGFSDGTGSAAAFYFDASYRGGIVYDPATDALYVTDLGNCAIRKVTAAGVVTTLVGGPAPTLSCGSADGPSSVALLQSAAGIAYDSSNGDLYITDSGNSRIRQMTAAGEVVNAAGSSASAGSGSYNKCGPPCLDGIGVAARFHGPMGAAYVPSTNSLYVSDTYDDTIRQVQL